MSELAELQKLFSDWVTHPAAGDEGIEDLIIGDGSASAAERIDIYRNAYRLRLIKAMAIEYPGLKELMGDHEFAELAWAFVQEHPPKHASLRWVGRGLARFVRQTPPWREQEVLAEMAAYEWAQGLAFDAADCSAVTVGELRALPADQWAGLSCRLAPSYQRLDLRWKIPMLSRELCLVNSSREEVEERLSLQSSNVATLRLLKKEGQGGDRAAIKELLRPQSESHPWVLWRQSLDIHWRSLGDAEAWALEQAREGRVLADICEGLCHWFAVDRVPLEFASMLNTWVEGGLVAEFLPASKPGFRIVAGRK